MSKKILLIEDELHLREGIRLNLGLASYKVFSAASGEEGIKMWESMEFDLIILDRMLPDMDGLKVLECIRRVDENLPVLILSAKGEVEDRKTGLRKGCDDYMAKPFDIQELELRIERLLKAGRSKKSLKPLYHFGANTINWELRTAHTSEGIISLTEQEIRILKYFAERPFKPVSRKDILISALGYERSISTRTVDNFLVRFRRYFEKNPKKPSFFKSVRSVGYLFNPEPGIKKE